METDLDQSRQRRRQVGVLTQALGQFVALKSSAEGWQAISTESGKDQTVSVGGDIAVHVDRKTSTNAAGQSNEIYRMTASIPLEAGNSSSKDTQGVFSTYLSELRDWQAVLESPGIRQQWNYFVSSSTTVEMLDAHTSITQSRLRSPVPGQRKAFAHPRDLLTVETSLVDPTTVVHIATSLPTSADDPVYLRPQPAVKRATSQLWAWCVEIATPLDALPALQQADDAQGRRARRAARRACVRVTCFLHLELGSWQATNAAACAAGANLIPALVAYLRMHGAPPRVARAGPAIALDRCERQQADCSSGASGSGGEVWELGYTVGSGSRTDVGAAQQQPVVAQILDEETMRQEARSGVGHERKGSSLTAYLAHSFQRQQGAAVALGTQAGGILRDGEALAVATMRAWLGGSMLELVVDAKASGSVDIGLALDGFGSARQLLAAIEEMRAAAPELFGNQQANAALPTEKELCDASDESQFDATEDSQSDFCSQLPVATVAARQLVQCFAVQSQRSGRRRLLVRIIHPPLRTDGTEEATAYGMSVTVRSGITGDDASQVRINGQRVVTALFALDAAAARRVDQSQAIKQSKIEHSEVIKQSEINNNVSGSSSSSSSTQNNLNTPHSARATGEYAQATNKVDRSTPPDGTATETTRRRSSGTASTASEAASQAGSTDGALQRLQLVRGVTAEDWTAAGTEESVQMARAEVAAVGGLVLRGTTLVEGWTEFDVAALVLGNSQPSGLWSVRHDLAQLPDGTTLHHCATRGSWGVAARDAVVARAWHSRRGHIDIAECSADDELAVESATSAAEAPAGKPPLPTSPIRAELGLSAWVLSKAAAGPVEPQRERSESAAADEEEAVQRRRQPAVRITHYLSYRPRGWLDSGALETALRSTGAALGIAAPVPAIPSPGLGAALVKDVTCVVTQLDRCGAPPAVVWTRNARVLGTAAGEQLEYRLAEGTAGGEAAEIEVRIEHRVWAHGGVPRQAAARVALTITPFPETSAVACFVDPHGDPHATRVRISHSRTALLPSVEDAGDGARRMAWPTVRVTVARAALETPPELPARVAPWSVPPRLVVNGVMVRVRYQRRDESGRGFYARCQSVPPHRVSALVFAAPPDAVVREPIEPLSELKFVEPAGSAEVVETDTTHAPLSIQRYSVRAVPTPVCCVDGPPQFAAAVAACFARIRREAGAPSAALDVDVAELHPDIPTTVASALFPGVSAARLVALLTHPMERRRWDDVLFDQRRELEHVVDGAQHATVVHTGVRVPPLCSDRDALTVCATELAPTPGFRDSTLTLVEASVPGAQPRESVVRAHLALYGVCIEPVEPSPASRITVACCLDLDGALPLPLRRALSARIPEEHLAQLRVHAALPPVAPWLEVPARVRRRTRPHGENGGIVTAEAHLALVDSRPTVFYCDVDPARIVREDFHRDGDFAVTVRTPSASPAVVAADVTSRLVRLRKSGLASVSVFPVVSEVAVDVRGFPCGVDVLVHVDGSPLAEHVVHNTGDSLCSAWVAPASDTPRLAVYVFSRSVDHDSSQSVIETYLIRVVCLPAESDPLEDEEDVDFNVVVRLRAADAAANAATPVQPPVVCNGQRLRVHSGQSAHQSLFFVETTDGECLSVCSHCGSFDCSDCNLPEDAASDIESSNYSAVAAPPYAQSTLRRRRVPSAISSADSSRVPSQQSPAALVTDAAAVGHRRPVLLPLIRFLAVLLPIRRLVIGQKLLFERTNIADSGPRVRKGRPVVKPSFLALVFTLLVGSACACLGLALANCTYAAS